MSEYIDRPVIPPCDAWSKFSKGSVYFCREILREERCFDAEKAFQLAHEYFLEFLTLTKKPVISVLGIFEKA